MTTSRLLRIPEAADALGVSRHTVYRLISAGELSTVHVGVKRTAARVEADSLESYIDRRRNARSA